MTIQEIEKQIKELQEELEKMKNKKEDRIEKYFEDILYYIENGYIEIYFDDLPSNLIQREYRKLQLEWELRKLLYDNNALPTEEEWKNDNIEKYDICFDYEDKNYHTNVGEEVKLQGTICSLDKELLENWFNNLSEEDKMIFVRG